MDKFTEKLTEKPLEVLSTLVDVKNDADEGTLVTTHGTVKYHFSIMWIGRRPDILSYISAALLLTLPIVYFFYILQNHSMVSIYVGVAAMIGIFHGAGLLLVNGRHRAAMKIKSKKGRIKKVGKITQGVGVLMLIYFVCAMIFDITVAIYSGFSAISEIWMLVYYGILAFYFFVVGSVRAYRNRKDRLILHSTYFSLDLSASYAIGVLEFGCLINYLGAWNAVLVVIGMIIAMLAGVYRAAMGVSLVVRGGMGKNIRGHQQIKPVMQWIDKYKIVFWGSEIYTFILAISSYMLTGTSAAYTNIGHLYLMIALLRLFCIWWCYLCDKKYANDEITKEARKCICYLVSGSGLLLISFCFLSAVRFLLEHNYFDASSESLSAFLMVQAGFFVVLLFMNIFTMVQGNTKRNAFNSNVGALNILLSSISGFSTLLSICSYFKGQFINGIATFLFIIMLSIFILFTLFFFIQGYMRTKECLSSRRGYALMHSPIPFF